MCGTCGRFINLLASLIGGFISVGRRAAIRFGGIGRGRAGKAKPRFRGSVEVIWTVDDGGVAGLVAVV